MARRLIAFMVLLMVTAACGRLSGTGAGPEVPDGDSPVTSSPQDPDEPIPSPTPRIVEPRDGLTGVHPNAFDKAVTVNDRRIRVEFYLGVEECYGLSRVDVEYGEEVVIITLHSGNVPGAEVCIDLAEFVATFVELDEPLNGRTIVDGAAEDDGSADDGGSGGSTDDGGYGY
jgi:hypothetical protein